VSVTGRLQCATRRFRALVLVAVCAAACAEERSRGGGHDSPAAPPSGTDDDCLVALRRQRVPFVMAPATRGVRTPVQITGSFGGVRLSPRARRPALMDCELARALVEAAPILRSVGIAELSYSGAYDYRVRRGSDRLSAHAHGLAIDVHELRGFGGELNVARDFERGRGWRELRPSAGNLEVCVGQPSTSAGRRLRRLVCELKHHSAFRVIATPDDDDDHRDHLHLEAFPSAVARVSRILGGSGVY
jgi:hypothetical protein